METIETRVIIAKALRTTFNKTKVDLLKETFWDDETLVKKVREMQKQYTAFNSLIKKIKEQDLEVYEKEILGL